MYQHRIMMENLNKILRDVGISEDKTHITGDILLEMANIWPKKHTGFSPSPTPDPDSTRITYYGLSDEEQRRLELFLVNLNTPTAVNVLPDRVCYDIRSSRFQSNVIPVIAKYLHAFKITDRNRWYEYYDASSDTQAHYEYRLLKTLDEIELMLNQHTLNAIINSLDSLLKYFSLYTQPTLSSTVAAVKQALNEPTKHALLQNAIFELDEYITDNKLQDKGEFKGLTTQLRDFQHKFFQTPDTQKTMETTFEIDTQARMK